MALKALLRSLLPALLVMSHGCSGTNHAPAAYHTGGIKPSRTHVPPVAIRHDPRMPRALPAAVTPTPTPRHTPSQAMAAKDTAAANTKVVPLAVEEMSPDAPPAPPPSPAVPSAGMERPQGILREEEFINDFDYGYPPPVRRAQPFSVTTEPARAPWNAKRQLLLVGIQGYRVPKDQIPASNLVFLLGAFGSMDESYKLPMLKASLKQLMRDRRQQDRVAIVSHAGDAGVALATPAGDQHATIDAAIDRLGAGCSTNDGAGTGPR
jgi:hypothetical protein